MKVLGVVLALALVVLPKPSGSQQAAGLVGQAVQAFAGGLSGSVQDPNYQTASNYAQVSSTGQQIPTGYVNTAHQVIAQPGMGITIGIGHHDHPVGTNYVQTSGLSDGGQAYYNGGQNQMTHVTSTETKSHVLGNQYMTGDPNLNGAGNPNHVVLHLNMANHGQYGKTDASTLVQNTAVSGTKYVGSFGGAPGILGNQEKQGWGVQTSKAPAITVSVAHPENQYGVGSGYMATSQSTSGQQFSGYQPQPGVVVETKKQTQYVTNYGEGGGVMTNQAQQGYGIQQQKPGMVHLMISHGQVPAPTVATNANSYYATSQQNVGVASIPSTYQQKTIRKVETVQATQPIPVQNTATYSTVQVDKNLLAQDELARCAPDSIYGTTCGPNVLRDSYGNEIKKTTTVQSVQYNPVQTVVNTVIPTTTVTRTINKGTTYTAGSVSKTKTRPIPDRIIGNGMGNVAVTRVEKTSTVAVPRVSVVKPVISVGVGQVNRMDGRYVGTFGGAPGIITATGPATNTVTRVATGTTTISKVPAVKNVYTQQRTTYVQPVVRQYASGTTYGISTPVINRGVTSTTYRRAVGVGTNVAKVSTVNNNLYASSVAPTQMTVRRYATVSTPVVQPRINIGVVSAAHEGSNYLSSANSQVHHTVQTMPAQSVGGSYYQEGTHYATNGYAAKPAVAVHITPMIHSVPMAHDGIAGSAYHETVHQQNDLHHVVPVKTTVQHTVYRTVNGDQSLIQPQQTQSSSSSTSASYSPSAHSQNTAEAAGGVLHHVMGGGAALFKLGSAMLGFGSGSTQYSGSSTNTKPLAQDNTVTYNTVPTRMTYVGGQAPISGLVSESQPNYSYGENYGANNAYIGNQMISNPVPNGK